MYNVAKRLSESIPREGKVIRVSTSKGRGPRTSQKGGETVRKGKKPRKDLESRTSEDKEECLLSVACNALSGRKSMSSAYSLALFLKWL